MTECTNCGHKIIFRLGEWKHAHGGNKCQDRNGKTNTIYGDCTCNKPQA